MWRESDGEREHEAISTSSSNSEVVRMDERAIACAPGPRSQPTNLQFIKSSGIHVGDQFVSVKQTVHNNEVVKGRFLGLELVSAKRTRKLRCSIAVFVCWALVVASGLAFVVFHFALAKKLPLDLDLPLPHYIWKVLKNTSRTERLSCAAALTALLTCLALIVYYTTVTKGTSEDSIDIAPHEWFITRNMWLAEDYNNTVTTAPFEPLRLVIVQHTVSSVCKRFKICAAEISQLQRYFLKNLKYDIPYNFMIGNDGRVYEGRGWGKVGAHTLGYNSCGLGLGFIGDYREELPAHAEVTPLMMERTQMLLKEGVARGILHPEFKIVGAKDLRQSDSPGSNLYNAIRQLPFYDHKNIFHGKKCDQIHAMFQNLKYNL